MKKPHSAQGIYDILPFTAGEFVLRKRTREDFDLLCEWPSYPAPYEGFNASYKNKSKETKDERFTKMMLRGDLVLLSAQHKKTAPQGRFPLIWYPSILRILG